MKDRKSKKRGDSDEVWRERDKEGKREVGVRMPKVCSIESVFGRKRGWR